MYGMMMTSGEACSRGRAPTCGIMFVQVAAQTGRGNQPIRATPAMKAKLNRLIPLFEKKGLNV